MTPKHDPKRSRQVLFYGTLAVILCLLGGVAVRRFNRVGSHFGDGLRTPTTGTRVDDLPQVPEPATLDAPTRLLDAGVIIDVRHPDAVFRVAGRNAWLQDALTQPIGQGFFGPWLGFLRTRGDSIGAAFRDTVISFVAEQLLGDTPARIVFFTGAGSFGTPVLVAQSPTSRARSAFDTMSQAVQRGAFLSSCPAPEGKDAKAPAAAPSLHIVRWVIADKPVYAALLDERIVAGATPEAVVQGACAALPEPTAGEEDGVEMVIANEAMGREAQLLAALLGLGADTRLSFALTETGIAPRGLSGKLSRDRLGVAPLSEDLLSMVPEDAPVLVGLQLNLPSVINRDSLKALFSGKVPAGSGAPRTVALLWYPHGDTQNGTDLAILWPHREDKAALQEAFSGANPLFWHEACHALVLTSNESMFNRIDAVCGAHKPSILHASPTVAAGLREPTSVMLGVHVGRYLARLTRDAYFSEYPPKDRDVASAPPEIEAAARTLLDLPWIGLGGTAKDGALQPKGFRS